MLACTTIVRPDKNNTRSNAIRGIDQSTLLLRQQNKTGLFRFLFLFCTLFFTTGTSLLSAQNFGGVPPGKAWKIKGNEYIDVIYNQSGSHIADTVLLLVNWVNKFDPYSLGSKREHVNIVLRNENLATNGFVGYIPFRSEFYLSGAQNPNVLGYNDWIRLLTLHEYRHVIQYSNMRWGISRIARDIFGDAAQAGVFNLLVPDWFSEGDAVFFESQVTGGGRGQLPAFSADFRALLLEDEKYSYWKYRNGSFKDLVPNKYVHGYMMTGFGYKNYQEHFWRDVLHETSQLKGLILPFRKAIQRNSGLKLPDFHDAMMDEYQRYLYDKMETTHPPSEELLPTSEKIKNEIQLLIDSAGTKYLLENSYDEISTVYRLEGSKKKKAFSLGRTNDPYLTLRGNRIYFTNTEVGSRWTNREFSDIYYYDLVKNKVHRVTRHKKYLAVDYQPGTGRYLAVEAGKNGTNNIVSFREGDDQVDTLLHDNNTYYSYPRWMSASGDELIFTGRKYGKMSLSTYDISSNVSQYLVGPVHETISRPFVTPSCIYFSSSKSGIDNIYYYDLKSAEVIPVTKDIIGAYNPTIQSLNNYDEDEKLFFSAKTASGQRIQSIPLSRKQLRSASNNSVPEYTPLYVTTNAEGLKMDLTPEDTIAIGKKYSPARHLIHFHSLYLEPSSSQPKLSLLSNDYLNTTKAGVYGSYLRTDESFEFGAEMTYAGWYPELTLNANHRFNRKLRFQLDDIIYTLPKTETSINANASVPLNFSRRHMTHFLRFTGQYGWTKEHFDPTAMELPPQVKLEPRLFQSGLFNVDWTFRRQMAYRDIFPKWGVTGNLLAKRSFSPGESWLLYGGQDYYLPGLFRNDGFKIDWQLQRNSRLANNFLAFELRTTHNLDYDYQNFHTGGILKLNYLFPLAYPEIVIPHVLYTKRVAVNLFTEYFQSNTQSKTWTGMDVFLTARYFNLFDFTAGLRISRQWNQESEPWSWSAVFLHDL
ncbi:hypothetical protein KUV50_09920 [Membranicola marinus]|uniref:WD40-like Beta Propeller Repeat n=1 Tax=Membranihabitans marinus TaxID=1227546 RepID=A0A953HM20_9BACT|nr:hypothetical protein [Membranihabitans marinus]MBY5958449.1 hypothetical protein [Membranihabitans marinus]